jgi:hypothetical protein
MKNFVAPIFLMLLFSSSAFAGGWSGSGSGTGVACFATAADAVHADQWLSRNKTLPVEILDKAKLQILERWEMTTLNQEVWEPAKGVLWQQHLEDMKSVLRADLPLFMLRLDQAADWIHFNSWQDMDEIQVLDDVEPIAQLPPECRKIQLVVRYSNGNNSKGEGPTENPIELKVVFLKRYFDRLPESDKAMLMLHEQLYVLGQAIGHPSSDIIRTFVRIFSDKSMSRMKGQAGHILLNDGLFEIKEQLIHYFGDYIQFFVDHQNVEAGSAFQSRHQFVTFLSMERRLRERMEACIGSGKDRMGCLKSTMDPSVLQSELTPEEAFVYFVFYGLERSLHKFNADQVMDPSNRDPKNFMLAMRAACEIINGYQGDFIAQKLIRDAHDYCQLAIHGNKSN